MSAADRPTELAEHLARLRRSADRPRDHAAERPRCDQLAPRLADLLAAEGLDGPDGDASVRITVSRGAFHGRGLLPPDESVAATIAIQAWPVVPPPADHLERGLHLVASGVRRDPSNPLATLKTTSRADYVYARLEARRAGADDALFLTIDGHLSEGTTANLFLVRRGRRRHRGARDARRSTARSCRGRPARGCSTWASRVGLRPVEAHLSADDLAAADEAFLSSSVAGVLPVTRFAGEPIGIGVVRARWTGQARADREAMIRGDGG